DEQLIARALEHLQTGGYGYTLSPGTYGLHATDEFWFDRKLGFCEHIASSFVILMRAAGIPARVVTGYQGGERNPVDGYVTVRQSDAHAWTEVWLPLQGWVRVDPTSAVAPSRTGSTARLTPAQGAVGNMLAAFSPALLDSLRNNWEALNNRWNQWVLSYSQGNQMDLLKKLGFDTPSWTELGYVLAGLLTAATLAGAAWAWWERQQHDPWLRLLERARTRARHAGLSADATTTPRELARLLRTRAPQTADTTATVQWLLDLEALRYAPSVPTDRRTATAHGPAHPGTLSNLTQRLARLRWPLPSQLVPVQAPTNTAPTAAMLPTSSTAPVTRHAGQPD
ncbi:MAG: transglutaminase-like domain-containing protein, partial [Burkholderiales bacterium]|nr:transglutaminase-like domain-containing protein [Burkholderiales bacterium]